MRAGIEQPHPELMGYQLYFTPEQFDSLAGCSWVLLWKEKE